MADISKVKAPNGKEYNMKDSTSRTNMSNLTTSFNSLQNRVSSIEEERTPITTSEIYYMMYNA